MDREVERVHPGLVLAEHVLAALALLRVHRLNPPEEAHPFREERRLAQQEGGGDALDRQHEAEVGEDGDVPPAREEDGGSAELPRRFVLRRCDHLREGNEHRAQHPLVGKRRDERRPVEELHRDLGREDRVVLTLVGGAEAGGKRQVVAGVSACECFLELRVRQQPEVEPLQHVRQVAAVGRRRRPRQPQVAEEERVEQRHRRLGAVGRAGLAEQRRRHAAEAVEGLARDADPRDGARHALEQPRPRDRLARRQLEQRVQPAEDLGEEGRGGAEERRRHRAEQLLRRVQLAVAAAEAARRPRAVVAAVAAAAVGLPRDVEADVVAVVVAVLEARLADDAGVVAHLARLALPDDVAVRERLRAHALRRARRELLERRRRAARTQQLANLVVRHAVGLGTHVQVAREQQPVERLAQLRRRRDTLQREQSCRVPTQHLLAACRRLTRGPRK